MTYVNERFEILGTEIEEDGLTRLAAGGHVDTARSPLSHANSQG
jgi:hypothetical protein